MTDRIDNLSPEELSIALGKIIFGPVKGMSENRLFQLYTHEFSNHSRNTVTVYNAQGKESGKAIILSYERKIEKKGQDFVIDNISRDFIVIANDDCYLESAYFHGHFIKNVPDDVQFELSIFESIYKADGLKDVQFLDRHPLNPFEAYDYYNLFKHDESYKEVTRKKSDQSETAYARRFYHYGKDLIYEEIEGYERRFVFGELRFTWAPLPNLLKTGDKKEWLTISLDWTKTVDEKAYTGRRMTDITFIPRQDLLKVIEKK